MLRSQRRYQTHCVCRSGSHDGISSRRLVHMLLPEELIAWYIVSLQLLVEFVRWLQEQFPLNFSVTIQYQRVSEEEQRTTLGQQCYV